MAAAQAAYLVVVVVEELTQGELSRSALVEPFITISAVYRKIHGLTKQLTRRQPFRRTEFWLKVELLHRQHLEGPAATLRVA